jgi:hypothetical protein
VFDTSMVGIEPMRYLAYTPRRSKGTYGNLVAAACRLQQEEERNTHFFFYSTSLPFSYDRFAHSRILTQLASHRR